MIALTEKDAISGKLRNLPELMPKADRGLHEFGKLLADRVDTQAELTPAGFGNLAILLLMDLREGADSHGQGSENSSLARYDSPMLYISLSERVPSIAKAVCPTEFGIEAAKLYDQARNSDWEKNMRYLV